MWKTHFQRYVQRYFIHNLCGNVGFRTIVIHIFCGKLLMSLMTWLWYILSII